MTGVAAVVGGTLVAGAVVGGAVPGGSVVAAPFAAGRAVVTGALDPLLVVVAVVDVPALPDDVTAVPSPGEVAPPATVDVDVDVLDGPAAEVRAVVPSLVARAISTPAPTTISSITAATTARRRQ